MGVSWLRVAVLGGTLAALAGGFAGACVWRQTGEYKRALSEISAHRTAEALRRLEELEGSRTLWAGTRPGEFDYWLGYCRWQAGRRDDALAAFARVPPTSPEAVKAAPYVAEGLLDHGRWREAESLLVHALGPGGQGLFAVRMSLDRVYRMQARFDDAADVIREAWLEAPEPVQVLRDLWRTERGTPPYRSILQALEIGAQLNPSDERVWLGNARVATRTGRLDEADRWLTKCELPSARPDEPVWRARLEWARAADRPDEVARALRILAAGRLHPVEIHTWRAWFHRRAGDSAAEREDLRALLGHEPRNPQWLSRLAELDSGSGEAAAAAALRALKAEVDNALDAYTRAMSGNLRHEGASERAQMGRMAEAAGLRNEAWAWYTLALRSDPADRAVSEALTRLTARESQSVPESSNTPEPWDRSTAVAHAWERSLTNPPARRAAPTFVEDTQAGLAHIFQNGETPLRQMPVALSGGVALIDYDRDGWLDVYCLQGGTFPPESDTSPSGGDRLFRNKGDGTFEDVTERTGIARLPRGYGHGVAVADVDNDGRADLFLTRWRSYALLRNCGDGTFQDVTKLWGLDGDRDWPTSAAFADLDGDGDLDLYVCHYVEWDAENPRICRNAKTNTYLSCNPTTCTARPDHLFRNDGNRFVDVSEEAGIRSADKDGRGLGVVAADLDHDGRVDLFVANDKSANFLFRNLGGMRFEEVAHAAGVASNADGGYQAGMGVACGDVDGDGRPDLIVTNYYGESTSYYHNLGGGLFSDWTAVSGLRAATRLRLGFGAVLLDADNDGRPDLMTANGHTDDLGDVPFRMPAQLLIGDGRGQLADVTDAAGDAMRMARLGRGLVAGDLDNDGRLDAVLVGQNEPLAMLRNTTAQPGHWITLSLEGRASNHDGIGAVVTVEARGRRQVLPHSGGGSYLSSGDPRLHFGLGDASRADVLEVSWPSGHVDSFRGLPADAFYRMREGDPEARREDNLKHEARQRAANRGDSTKRGLP